jgi:hypothetical protein
MRDSTTANGGYRILTAITAFRLAGGEKVVCTFQRNTARTTVQFRIGFQDSTTFAAPTDGAYINFDGLTGNIDGRTRNNNAQSITGTSYALPNSTWVTGIIEVISTSRVDFQLFSGSGTLLWSDSLTTNIPSGAGRETGCGVLATESSTNAAAEIVRLDYLRIEVNRLLVR